MIDKLDTAQWETGHRCDIERYYRKPVIYWGNSEGKTMRAGHHPDPIETWHRKNWDHGHRHHLTVGAMLTLVPPPKTKSSRYQWPSIVRQKRPLWDQKVRGGLHRAVAQISMPLMSVWLTPAQPSPIITHAASSTMRWRMKLILPYSPNSARWFTDLICRHRPKTTTRLQQQKGRIGLDSKWASSGLWPKSPSRTGFYK